MPFKFIVGKDEEEFYLPADLVATQSAKLHALVNSGMQESIEKKVKWPQMDRETFFRFGDFCLAAVYDPGQPRPRPGHEMLPFANNEIAQVATQGQRNKHADRLWKTFLNLHSNPDPAQSKATDTDTEMCYTRVLGVHAKMYVFADYHGIDPLKDLSFQYLHHLLESFVLNRETRGDFVKLVEYTMDNTVDLDDSQDRLRDLVITYAACHFEILIENKDFQSLMDPELSVPLVKTLTILKDGIGSWRT